MVKNEKWVPGTQFGDLVIGVGICKSGYAVPSLGFVRVLFWMDLGVIRFV